MSNERVSVLIPARNEVYLQKTIDSILSAAEGDIEIVAVCDGYWPDPPIQDDPRVTLIHHTEAIGQRPAINEAARIATGKYVLKTDGHSMFDQGFDVKLKADCEYDWTVIPRMYNLDVEKWEPKWNKRTDYMWIRSPEAKDKSFRHNYWDGPCAKEFPAEYKIYKKKIQNAPEIDDVMTGQGACFFMHKERFWELGGMDEAHGQWGQMGIELACKAWLSGGRQVVNKKTWFAHWFRGGGGPGFPWPASGKEQEFARKYSKKLWTSGKWPLQKRPLQWLVDKFAPVPTWNEKKKNYGTDTWIAKGRVFKVEELYEKRLEYSDQKKSKSLTRLFEVFPPIVERILGDECFSDETIQQTEYYDYLVSRLHPSARLESGPSDSGKRHCLNMFKDLVRLCGNIKKDGLKAPLDMYLDKKGKPVLTRGTRRLEIIHQLGRTNVPVRLWRTEWLARHYIPSAAWPEPDGSIHALAVEQFLKLGHKATDKYWVHGYTPLYDRHIGHLRGKKRGKLLELGVKTGMSLAMWNDAFPKANIYGLDLDPKQSEKVLKRKKRVKVFGGKEEDIELLKTIGKEGPFDVIIDDCEHRPIPQRRSFDALWPYVANGGFYIIEDLHPNYADRYSSNSIMPYLQSLTDSIWTDHQIKEVAFYPNIIFIQKA